MTGMNTGLAQLALMLHGMGRDRFGNQFNLPADPYSMAPQMPQPMGNNWAANPGFHTGGGNHLPITPAQEYFLFDPEVELPLGRTVPLPKPWFQPPEPPPSAYPTDLPPFVVPRDPFFEPPTQWQPRFDRDEIDEENWPIPDDDDPCKEEVVKAIERCRLNSRRVKRGQASGNLGVTFRQCMRGQLSAACGGNLTAQLGSPKTFS
jgi:hypothetical protein